MTTSYRRQRPSVRPRTPGAPVRLPPAGPADLLAAVPFLLGFHPTESLVALLLRPGGCC